jgi:PAS domain S-box-containing protein
MVFRLPSPGMTKERNTKMNSPILAPDLYPYRQPHSSRAIQEEKQVRLDPYAGLDFHQLMKSVWKNSVDSMRVTDSEGIIVAVNDAYCRFVGMQPGELIGKTFTIVYDGSTDPARLVEKYCRRFKEKSVEPLMGRQIHLRNGKEAYVEISNSYIKGSAGEAFLLSISRDVTERRQLEQALERERGLLRTIIDNLPDRIFAKDTESRFSINNDAHIQALGAESQSKVIGKTDFDFRPRDLAEGMFIDDQEVIRSGKRILEKEEQTVDPSGRSHCRLVTKVPMHDKEGTVVGLVGISRDVTERKRAEEELKKSEDKFRAIFDHASDGMFLVDLKARKLFICNATCAKMLGYAQEEFSNLDIADIHPREDLPFVYEQVAKFSTGEEGIRSDIRFKRKDGSILVTDLSPALLRIAEKEYLLIMFEDITERRALEARVQEHVAALKTSQESLSELNAQKDRLFSILSHDLRSPFTSILGFCGILLDEGESLSAAERKEFLGHIQNSAKRQMALLNKLLDWSRLETGRIKFDVRDVDLALVVAHSVRSHLGIAKKKEITLQSTLPAQIKTRGDEVMIGQVFSNLISNALKFTPAHGLISIDLVESKEDQWVLAVKDTGAGIPKDDFGKLFKIEEKYTRKGLEGEEGTGLGLSVVHEIIKKHSGSITIESEVGEGTTFFIHLPRLMENIARSVLVVDDDEGVRVLHSRFLKRMFPDSRIIQASDGKEAFELAKRYRPQIIVTDYSMPEMNGFEFLKVLRQEAGTKEIPVFVITGKDSTASREAMRLSGAAAVLTKPVSSTQLQEAIDKVMAERA